MKKAADERRGCGCKQYCDITVVVSGTWKTRKESHTSQMGVCTMCRPGKSHRCMEESSRRPARLYQSVERSACVGSAFKEMARQT
ncbi:hypothetical protein AVEN_11887-1 [Araneus ventricosus]|uniref:Uncharacterized protein n=1 Tax=Araneus ventricosus TaxID=182803 RepID=A0A4Y2BP83_ARAVE|nr:hypothetical protein AVEN_11887-1 [Araneus ventricosus]